MGIQSDLILLLGFQKISVAKQRASGGYSFITQSCKFRNWQVNFPKILDAFK
jgi:hypothetical protein